MNYCLKTLENLKSALVRENVIKWHSPRKLVDTLILCKLIALELSCEHLQSQHWIFHPVTLTSIPTPGLPQDRLPSQQTHILYESEKFQ